MLFHTQGITDAADKLREARGVVNFVHAALEENSVEAQVLNAKEIASYEDSFLFHDLLVEQMEPFYLGQFLKRAAAAGLQYVGEANPRLLLPPDVPEAVLTKLDSIGDRIAREQYLDFITCRKFRATILSRAGKNAELRFIPERMQSLYISGGTFPVAPIADVRDAQEVQFRVPNALSVKVNEAVPKALFLLLGEAWPKSYRFDDLKRAVFERAGETLDAEAEMKFAVVIGRCFARGLLYLRSFEPRLCAAPSERPHASDVARMWVKLGTHVPSMTLSVWEVDEPEMRELLPLLDGEHDRRQLAAELSRSMGREFSDEQIERALKDLAGFGILVS
jgi:hypothetical protein